MSTRTSWTEDDFPNATISDAVVVITGASSGIGLEAARIFAQKGWAHVIMAVRNVRKAEECVEALRPRLTEAQLSSLKIMQVDVSSSESIHKFSQEFHSKYDKLHVLVNNAGVMFVGGKSPDGHEVHMGTNVFGPFIMTALLLDLIVKTSNARIVNVSSSIVKMSREDDLADLTTDLGATPRSYARSKICNVLFTHELARRLEASGKNKNNTINLSCHPGYADTNLQYADKHIIIRGIMTVSNYFFAQAADKGSWPIVLASIDPTASSGDFYGPNGFSQIRGDAAKTEEMSPLGSIPELGKNFFDQCEKITGIKYDEIFQKL